MKNNRMKNAERVFTGEQLVIEYYRGFYVVCDDGTPVFASRNFKEADSHLEEHDEQYAWQMYAVPGSSLTYYA